MWLPIYLVLEICNIWPFMAANAAVPLAAAIFGHLPTDADYQLLGITLTEAEWVKAMGYAIFLLAFLPLVFGGTIYRVIEKMMTFKVVVVLLVVAVIAVFQVSWDNMVEVVTGFGRFGQVPDRAESVIAEEEERIECGEKAMKIEVHRKIRTAVEDAREQQR